MRRVFAVDVLACSMCGGRLRVHVVVSKLLAVLHLPTEPPKAHRARDGPQKEEEDQGFWA